MHSLKSYVVGCVTTVALIAVPSLALADQTDSIIASGQKRLASGAKSQVRIDELSDQTDKIVSKYNAQKKVVEGLKVYNDRLRQTLKAQEVAMTSLRTSIENASLIERQIMPLMNRMLTGLETFINDDLPFRLEERQARIDRIRGLLTNANVSAAERFRQVLLAYQIENDYGQAVAVYPGKVNVDGAEVNGNLLQLGRSALYYQTYDGSQSGIYDKQTRAWVKLDSSHNNGINRAIKVAQKKISPELMLLPLPAPEEI